MSRWTQLGGTIAVAGAILVLAGGAVGAGSDPPPQPIDADTLEQIRDQIPKGFPGESDLVESDGKFGELATTIGAGTDVADFGAGSQLEGVCGGWAYSYDKNGELLDAAIDLGDDNPPIDLLSGLQAFTASNPFKVDTRGVVTYYGFSPRIGDGPQNHKWSIKTSGISLDSGGDPNTNLKNRNVGLVDLDNDLPVKFAAKVKVEGEMMSENQPVCIGKGHVEFIGNGITDPVGLAAIALLGGGVLGLLFNARPAKTYKVG